MTEPAFSGNVEDPAIKAQLCRNIAYLHGKNESNRLFDQLENQLDEIERAHLIAIGAVWDERIHGVARYAVRLGARFALAIIEAAG